MGIQPPHSYIISLHVLLVPTRQQAVAILGEHFAQMHWAPVLVGSPRIVLWILDLSQGIHEAALSQISARRPPTNSFLDSLAPVDIDQSLKTQLGHPATVSSSRCITGLSDENEPGAMKEHCPSLLAI